MHLLYEFRLIKKLILSVLFIMPIGVFAASLTVTVDGIHNNKGSIIVTLFSSPAAFNQQSFNLSESTIVQRAQNNTMTFTFNNLKEGKYAFAVLHDKNQDNSFSQYKMNSDGYAFSNNAGKMSTPTFKEAAIEVKAGNKKYSAKLSYLPAKTGS